MKTKLFFAAILAVLLFSSCSSDDSQASIVGVWKFNRVGGVVSGEEVLTPYDHSPGCGKDNTEFRANGTIVDTYYSTDCEAVPHTGTYTKQGNTLTITLSDGPNVFTILKLTSTILKVKNDEGGIVELIK